MGMPSLTSCVSSLRRYIRGTLILLACAASVVLLIVLALYFTVTPEGIRDRLTQALENEYGIEWTAEAAPELKRLPSFIVRIPRGHFMHRATQTQGSFESAELELSALAYFAETPRIRTWRISSLTLTVPGELSREGIKHLLEELTPYPVDELLLENATILDAGGNTLLTLTDFRLKREKFSHFALSLSGVTGEDTPQTLSLQSRLHWMKDAPLTEVAVTDFHAALSVNGTHTWRNELHVARAEKLFSALPALEGISGHIAGEWGEADFNGNTLNIENGTYHFPALSIEGSLKYDAHPVKLRIQADTTYRLSHELEFNELYVNLVNTDSLHSVGNLYGKIRADLARGISELTLDGALFGESLHTDLTFSRSPDQSSHFMVSGLLHMRHIPDPTSAGMPVLLDALHYLTGKVRYVADNPHGIVNRIEGDWILENHTLRAPRLDVGLEGGGGIASVTLEENGRWHGSAQLATATLEGLQNILPIRGPATLQLRGEGNLESDNDAWHADIRLGKGCLTGGDITRVFKALLNSDEAGSLSDRQFKPSEHSCYDNGRLIIDGKGAHWDIPLLTVSASQFSLDAFGSRLDDALSLKGTFTSRSNYAYDPELRLAVEISRLERQPVRWQANWDDAFAQSRQYGSAETSSIEELYRSALYRIRNALDSALDTLSAYWQRIVSLWKN